MRQHRKGYLMDLTDRAEIIAALLAGPCTECGAAAKRTCVLLTVPSLGAVRLNRDGPVVVHVSRVRDAIAASRVSRNEVRGQFRGPVPAGL